MHLVLKLVCNTLEATFLFEQNRVLRLTENHLPSVDRELARIKSCGGVVTSSSIGSLRVQGRLEMTRSIGDLDLKPYGVIAEPDVRSIEVNKYNIFIVLCLLVLI